MFTVGDGWNHAPHRDSLLKVDEMTVYEKAAYLPEIGHFMKSLTVMKIRSYLTESGFNSAIRILYIAASTMPSFFQLALCNALYHDSFGAL